MSGKKTRRAWAEAYGVPYGVMAEALRDYAFRERLPRGLSGEMFDGETVQNALVQYYAAKRDRRMREAYYYNQIINDIRDRGILD